jgi:hypothetical protein
VLSPWGTACSQPGSYGGWADIRKRRRRREREREDRIGQIEYISSIENERNDIDTKKG